GGQIWAVIAFLESQGGEVTVTSDDVKSAGGGAGKEEPASGAEGGTALSATTDPKAILNEKTCMGCHKLGDEGGAIGPPFTGMGSRVSKDYIRESILDPNAKVA